MRTRTRGRRSGQRGATMLEALVAVVVLSVGTAAIAELLKHVSKAQSSARFHGAAIDLYAQIAAQIQDSHCDVLPDGTITLDRGLAIPEAWIGDAPWGLDPSASPLPGSSKIAGARVYPEHSPPLVVRYQVTAPITPADGPPRIDARIEIRQIMNTPEQDDPSIDSGYWIRSFPMVKVCNQRLEDNGRGEFYN